MLRMKLLFAKFFGGNKKSISVPHFHSTTSVKIRAGERIPAGSAVYVGPDGLMYRSKLASLEGTFYPWDAPVVTPSPEAPPTSPDGMALWKAIDDARFGRGCDALAIDDAMSQAAQGWAEHLASVDGLAHGDFAGRIWAIHPNTPIGEVAAEGETLAANTVSDWLSDPAHRTILLGDFDRVGCGVAADAKGVKFYVADFALVGSD